VARVLFVASVLNMDISDLSSYFGICAVNSSGSTRKEKKSIVENGRMLKIKL